MIFPENSDGPLDPAARAEIVRALRQQGHTQFIPGASTPSFQQLGFPPAVIAALQGVQVPNVAGAPGAPGADTTFLPPAAAPLAMPMAEKPAAEKKVEPPRAGPAASLTELGMLLRQVPQDQQQIFLNRWDPGR